MKTYLCLLALLLTSATTTVLPQEPVPEHPKLFFNLQEANQIRARALVPEVWFTYEPQTTGPIKMTFSSP